MKWKMAPNSVFAILLRSPWWVSIAVVLGFALVARALLPEQYMVFGVMGSLPFIVIGMIAAFRQFQAPGSAQVQRTLQNASAMSWRDFANALEQGYAGKGYQVSRIDGKSADLLLAKGGRHTIVAGKRWKAGNHGLESLRNLKQACQMKDASGSVYVTLSEVGEKTRSFASANGIELLNGAALAQLLQGTVAARK